MVDGKECQSAVACREFIPYPERAAKECQSAEACREFIPYPERAAPVRSPRSLTDGEPLAVGSTLNARYVMRRMIGQGMSSNVWECVDKVKKELVVAKIINDIEPYNQVGYKEVLFNNFLGNIDESEIYFPRMLDHFEHCNLLCIVFEKLGLSICDALKVNRNYPLPLSLVRDIARQLLESVEFLHRSHVIHTDLKTDNILFVSRVLGRRPLSKTAPGLLKVDVECNYILPISNAIKVIDFGNACAEKDASNYTIGAPAYRAPEVILGLGWSFPCDIWSVGCILVELCMGVPIFNVAEDMEHLAWIEAFLGRFPSQMLKRAKHTDAKKYVMEGMLKWPTGATSLESMQRVERLAPFQSEKNMRLVCDSEDFIQLVLHLLKPDPSERLTAKEALNHPFFTTDSLN